MNHYTRRILTVALLCIATAGCESPASEQPTSDADTTVDGSLSASDDVVGTTDATDSDGYTTGTWCGEAIVGPEQWSFRPCGTNERWWLGSGAIYGDWGDCDYQANYAGCGSYACVTGTLSPTKPIQAGYGHLGGYARELIVSEILEKGVQTEEKCPHPAQP